jgi:hypothetical protein
MHEQVQRDDNPGLNHCQPRVRGRGIETYNAGLAVELRVAQERGSGVMEHVEESWTRFDASNACTTSAVNAAHREASS